MTQQSRRQEQHGCDEGECGAQDQGNELTLLLNEVGAQSFLDVKDKDKEKDEKGPVGNA